MKNNKVMITNKPYSELKGGFFIVPNNLGLVLSELNLKPNDRLVYMCLLRFANNSKNPFPSYKKIKEYTGISSNNTVSSAIKNLEEAGLIVKLHKGTTQGDSNVYQVKFIYPVVNENIEPSEAIKDIKQPKPLPKQNKATQKVNKPQEKPVIPFRRGVHDDIKTSKEVEENIAYFESDKFKEEEKLVDERFKRLFGEMEHVQESQKEVKEIKSSYVDYENDEVVKRLMAL